MIYQGRFVPQNVGFDVAAAANYMLLMAHVLGLDTVLHSCLAWRYDERFENI